MLFPNSGLGKHLGDDVVFTAGLRFPHQAYPNGVTTTQLPTNTKVRQRRAPPSEGA